MKAHESMVVVRLQAHHNFRDVTHPAARPLQCQRKLRHIKCLVIFALLEISLQN
jgi:hypothetical protein